MARSLPMVTCCSPPTHGLTKLPSAGTRGLIRRDIVKNVHGYMLYDDYRQPHPPLAIIAVENGDVDIAVVRDPMVGYFAAQEFAPFAIEPVQLWRKSAGLPMAFDMSTGVRRGGNALLQRLNDLLERNGAAILAILGEYHVPVLPQTFIMPEARPH